MKQRLIVNFAVAAALAILAAIGWEWAHYRNDVVVTDHAEIQAYTVIHQLDDLLSTLEDAETGQRGFLITGATNYLEPYSGAVGRADENLAILKSLTKDNPRQQQRLAALESLTQSKFAVLKQTIDLRAAKGFESAREIVMTGQGKVFMDQIRQQVAEAKSEEARLLQERSRDKEISRRNMSQIVIGGGMFSCLLFSAAYLLLKREIKARAGIEQELREHRAQLEGIVADRTRELQASLARNLTFAAATFEGIVESEHERIVDCNEQCARMLGRAVPELKGLALAELMPPEDRERMGELIRLAPECSVEHSLLRMDGSRLLAETRIRFVSAEYPRRLIVIRDITDRRQAETALSESEAKYRNLFLNITEEVHFWKLVRDEQGRIQTWRLVDANPPALKSWGQARQAILGKTTDEIFGPGATEHYLPVVQKIMREGGPHTFEDYFPNLDKHFRFTSVPLGDFFITTGADITDLKKAHVALQESEARLRSLFENSPDAIFLARPGGPVVSANPAACAIFGHSEAELCQGGLALIEDHADPRHAAAVAECARTGKAKYEATFVHKDGARFPAEVSSVIVDGGTRSIVILRDITERKRTEERIQQQVAELRKSRIAALNLMDDAVAARAQAEEAEAHLRQQMEALRVANEQLARFNRAAVGRELRMIELKKEVNALCPQAGQPPRYALHFDHNTTKSPIQKSISQDTST